MSSTTQGDHPPQASSSSSSILIEAPKRRRSHAQQHGPTKRTKLMRIIGRSLLGVMVLVGLAIVICWLLVFPKTPIFTVESGHVTAHSLTDRKLNATIAFTIKSFNPNKRASIHLDSMRMTADEMGQKFSSTLPSYSQPPGNQTVLNPVVIVNFIYPFGRMKELVQSEGIFPEVRFAAKISYVVDKWTSKRRLLEVYCARLRLKINGTTPFDNAKCTVDL